MNTYKIKKVIDYLQKIGLSELEAKLYNGLLETGTTTVMELANHVGIKRITAHFNIERLIEMGLVSETRKGARRQIVAEGPERLEGLIQKREEELQGLKSQFPLVADLFNTSPGKQTPNEVAVSFYEGKKAVWRVYEDMLRADEVYSFINIDKFYSSFPDTEDEFKKGFDKNPDRKFYAIALDTPLARAVEMDEKDRYPHYYCKYIPSTEDNPISTFANLVEYQIYEDRVAIIQSEGTNPTATVISSEVLHKSFVSLHKFIWQLLK